MGQLLRTSVSFRPASSSTMWKDEGLVISARPSGRNGTVPLLREELRSSTTSATAGNAASPHRRPSGRTGRAVSPLSCPRYVDCEHAAPPRTAAACRASMLHWSPGRSRPPSARRRLRLARRLRSQPQRTRPQAAIGRTASRRRAPGAEAHHSESPAQLIKLRGRVTALTKSQMYGRGKIDLLQASVVGAG
jgi:hypothetical protein